jgi:hypothetical protein
VTREYLVDDVSLPLHVEPADAQFALHLGEGWNSLDWSIHIVGPDFDRLFENAWPDPMTLPDVGTYRISLQIDATTDHTVPLGNGILDTSIAQYGFVPEPSTALLLGLALAGLRGARSGVQGGSRSRSAAN